MSRPGVEPPGYAVFISHGGSEGAEAEELYRELTSRRPSLKVFLDSRAIEHDWVSEVPQALQASRMSVFLLSSGIEEAYYVREEVVLAVELHRRTGRRHKIVPVFLDPGVKDRIPFGLASQQGLDLASLGGMGAVADGVLSLLDESETFELTSGTALSSSTLSSSTMERSRCLDELTRLPVGTFEGVLQQLGVPDEQVPAIGSQATRAVELLHFVQLMGEDLSVVQAAIDSARRLNRPARRLGAWVTGIRPVRYVLERMGLLSVSPQERAVQDYLRSEINLHSRDVESFVTPSGEVRDGGAMVSDGVLERTSSRRAHVTPSRVRLLKTATRHQATAQIAAAHNASTVRDVGALLLKQEAPLLLLGDPGSGKTMTVRHVHHQICRSGIGSSSALVPVYIRLGQYTGRLESVNDVHKMVLRSIDAEHRALGRFIPALRGAGRLVLIFDGMDEMPRDRYRDRISVLSAFADRYGSVIRMLFTCRTNDFSPAFRQQQLVLLPFDHRQIRRFVENNLTPAIRIGDRVVDHDGFIDRLLRTSRIGHTATNPMVLALVCHFVRNEERWPESRAELFESYVTALLDRPAKLRELYDVLMADREGALAGWGALAFLMTSKQGRVAVEVEEVSAHLGPEATEDLVSIGIRAGLLTADGTGQWVSFTHHRLQEYFTARHISETWPSLDWAALVEVPQWQETLISLVSLTAEVPAVALLLERFRRTHHLPLDPESERSLADQLVFASHLMREVRYERPENRAFMGEIERLVVMASEKGRPTTVVKMLWCCRNVPELPVARVVRAARASDVGWVREQAMIVSGSVGGRTASMPDSFAGLLTEDLVRERVTAEMSTYWRVLQDPGAHHRRSAVLAVLGTGLVFSGILSVVLSAPVFAGVAWLTGSWPLALGVSLLLLLISTGVSGLVSRKLSIPHWKASFRVMGALLGAAFFIFALGVLEVSPIFAFMILAAAVGLYQALAVTVGQPWFRLRLTIGQALLRATTGRPTAEEESADFRGEAGLRDDLGQIGSMAISILLVVAAVMYGDRAAQALLSPVGLVVLVVVGVLILGFWMDQLGRVARAISEKSAMEGVSTGRSLVMALVPLGLAGIVTALGGADVGTGSKILLSALVTLGLMGLALLVLIGTAKRIAGRGGRARWDLAAGFEGWLSEMHAASSDARRQAALLKGIGLDTFRMPARDFLHELRQIESLVGPDPAESAYARLVYEVEAMARQESVDIGTGAPDSGG